MTAASFVLGDLHTKRTVRLESLTSFDDYLIAKSAFL